MADLTFSSFAEDKIPAITALTATEYRGREISDERYLYWEYVLNPAGEPVMQIAESEGRIVSQYAVIPRLFNHSGKRINGSLSVNTITHPDFRGRDLFNRLAQMTFDQSAKNGILFTIGFPNPVSLPVIRKKKIFEVTGALSVLFYPLHPVRTFFRYISDRKQKSGDEIPLSIDTSSFLNISSFKLGSASDSFNALMKAFNLQNQFTTERNSDFMKWRYVDIPRRTYHALQYESAGMKTLIIFRSKYIFGIRCLIIVDIISIDQQATGDVMKAIKHIAKRNDIDLLFSAVARHSEEYSTMRSAGYISLPNAILPQKLTFIVRKHRDDCPPGVMNFENWFLTFGDYDIF
jgi:hypothetical protein